MPLTLQSVKGHVLSQVSSRGELQRLLHWTVICVSTVCGNTAILQHGQHCKSHSLKLGTILCGTLQLAVTPLMKTIGVWHVTAVCSGCISGVLG